MPNRILKESIKTSTEIDELTWFEEVLFYRLIVTADDYGCYDGRSAVLKSILFPTKDSVTKKAIDDGLAKLIKVGLVEKYVVDEHPYIHLLTFNTHQRQRTTIRKYPAPDESAATCGNLPQSAAKCHHESESESNPNPIRIRIQSNPKGKSVTAAQFTPPSLSELQEYISANGYGVDPQNFIDYYESNGWIVGKTRMKDWRATVRNWDRREKAKAKKDPLPDYWNPDPIREKDPKPASKEEAERVRAILNKGKGGLTK